MNRPQALELQHTYETIIRSIFTQARLANPTRMDMVAEIERRVWQQPEVQKAPGYVKAYLTGYDQALQDVLHSDHLEMIFFMPEGTWVPENELTPGSVGHAVGSGLFWRQTPGEIKWGVERKRYA